MIVEDLKKELEHYPDYCEVCIEIIGEKRGQRDRLVIDPADIQRGKGIVAIRIPRKLL